MGDVDKNLILWFGKIFAWNSLSDKFQLLMIVISLLLLLIV